MAVEQDKNFVEFVVKNLVDNPQEVEVRRSVDEKGVFLEVSCDKADVGKIIGKKGQNAQALRTLLKTVGAKNNMKINLKIVEPQTK